MSDELGTVQDDEGGSSEDREAPVVSTILPRPTGFAGQVPNSDAKQDALRSLGEAGLKAHGLRRTSPPASIRSRAVEPFHRERRYGPRFRAKRAFGRLTP
jgi:hypothetical protein